MITKHTHVLLRRYSSLNSHQIIVVEERPTYMQVAIFDHCLGEQTPQIVDCIWKPGSLPQNAFRFVSYTRSSPKVTQIKSCHMLESVIYCITAVYLHVKWNNFEIILKLFQCFISHETTSETEKNILFAEGVLKLFEN